MEVLIIDNGGANLTSLEFAFERLGARTRVSSDAREIAGAARVVLPGVGSAHDAMRRLRAARLADLVRGLKQPVLGICLGMQLLFERSEEGATECLGVLAGTVRRLEASRGLPVPHMGWNRLGALAEDPLLQGIECGTHFYFVHSYAAAPTEVTVAEVEYGGTLSAVIRRGNFWGTQFHPERSAAAGARLLENFLRCC
jgi:glutamine amidotransferase